ncbi:MAG: phosphoribosylaminoimidazolesuccinocarboxamide synthase [Candidatus Solibacter usitatus]|nr:phosphoribosylaminoimidazolesuccinocarboxamide synthase [Candidatus Solibacter usitatus]
MSSSVLTETSIPGVTPHARGKVRDVYACGDHLIFVATDRISAFDCVLPNGIPDKGRVLTQMSIFWFDFLKDIVPTHFVTADAGLYPEPFRSHRDQLEGRSMMVRRAKMFDAECVARGYVSGSGWKDYKSTGSICGIALPAGLQESSRLPEPIFTPATKAQTGHDENIPFETFCAITGEMAHVLRDLTLRIYSTASAYAAERGMLLADTKFEFGMVDGTLVLADEVLTPDSSRFWPRDTYSPGGAQKSYDKQYVRDYLETLDWDKRPPAPPLPPEVIERTAGKYREAYRALTGRNL